MLYDLQLVEPRYMCWRSDSDYRIPRVDWRDGKMQIIRLENHWPQWDSTSGEIVVADMRLAEPPQSAHAENTSSTVHQIRALVTDAEPVNVLLRSMDEGDVRIVMIPRVTQGPDNTLSIDLAFRCDAADVDGANDFRRLWGGIIQRAADNLMKELSVGIEQEIRILF